MLSGDMIAVGAFGFDASMPLSHAYSPGPAVANRGAGNFSSGMVNFFESAPNSLS